MLFFLQNINQIQFKRLNLNGIMFYQIYFAASERPLVYTKFITSDDGFNISFT